MDIQQLGPGVTERSDLPLMMQLGQKMPAVSRHLASGPQGEQTRAQYGTHVPTGPGNANNDINVDWTFD